MTDYLVTVNGREIPLNTSEIDALNSISIDAFNLHILEEDEAYSATVLDVDFLNKTYSIAINGNTYQIHIEDKYDQQVKKMGLLAASSQKVNTINAPMPGLIIDLMVEVGQEVSEGTPLLILSAMKMENVILSQGEGVVKSIEVNKNDAVEKGQLIIEME